jgi:hypothetical protein
MPNPSGIGVSDGCIVGDGGGVFVGTTVGVSSVAFESKAEIKTGVDVAVAASRVGEVKGA